MAVKPEQLVLRDELAVNRTVLANERTLLAFVRTALALSMVGVTFIKFFGDDYFELLGWFFVPAGIIVLAIGLRRYRLTRILIDEEISGK